MSKTRLVSNINVRLSLDDMNAIRHKAEKLRMPVSTYCRIKLTEHIQEL